MSIEPTPGHKSHKARLKTKPVDTFCLMITISESQFSDNGVDSSGKSFDFCISGIHLQ